MTLLSTTGIPIRVNHWSLVTSNLIPFLGASPLSRATGVIVRTPGGQKCILTNYHVVSGRNPITGVRKTPSPDRLLVSLPRLFPNCYQPSWRWEVVELTSSSGANKFVLHPEFRERFDVAAIPLPRNQRWADYEESTDFWNDRLLCPGDDVCVLGFPEGIATSGILPIWKSGAIASDPYLPIDTQEYFLVDAATREGMSGGPVVRLDKQSFRENNGTLTPVTQFLGLYAGRCDDMRDMTLGRVWRQGEICKILADVDKHAANASTFPILTTLKHWITPDMTQFENKRINDDTDYRKLIHMSCLHDQRFGVSINDLLLGAKLDAACREAEGQQTIDLTKPQAGIVIDSLTQPAGWTYNSNHYSIAMAIQELIDDLKTFIRSE